MNKLWIALFLPLTLNAVEHLFSAAAQGNILVLENAVADGVKLTLQQDIIGKTLLHHAAQKGHAHVVALLTTPPVHAFIDRKEIATGTTALHKAALHGHVEVVEKLIDAGATPTITDHFGCTPLHTACWAGKLAVVQYFARSTPGNMALPTTPFVPTFDRLCLPGDTPLHLAARHGHLSLVEFLIKEVKLDVHARNTYNMTPLEYAQSTPGNNSEKDAVLSYLKEHITAEIEQPRHH